MDFNGYTKDLATINPDLSSIFILDNSPAAYRSNPGELVHQDNFNGGRKTFDRHMFQEGMFLHERNSDRRQLPEAGITTVLGATGPKHHQTHNATSCL